MNVLDLFIDSDHFAAAQVVADVLLNYDEVEVAVCSRSIGQELDGKYAHLHVLCLPGTNANTIFHSAVDCVLKINSKLKQEAISSPLCL